MRRAWCTALLGLVACGANHAAVPPGTPASDVEPPAVPVPDPVQLDLIADVGAVGPGQVFTVAARLRIAPGWHIYWLNPGEAGQATVGTFAVPAGFAAGPVRYPGPSSFEGAGGLRLYGYANEVLLSTEVAAPDTLAEATPISVEARWMACSDACVKGSARAELTLATASEVEPSEPIDQQLFARHAARLAQPFDGECMIDWVTDAVSLRCPGASDAEFFPDAELQPAYAGQLAVARDGGVSVRVTLRERRPVSGVLRLVGAEGATFYAVALAPPT